MSCNRLLKLCAVTKAPTLTVELCKAWPYPLSPEPTPITVAILPCSRSNLAAVIKLPTAIVNPYTFKTHSTNFSSTSLLVSSAIPTIDLDSIVVATPSSAAYTAWPFETGPFTLTGTRPFKPTA